MLEELHADNLKLKLEALRNGKGSNSQVSGSWTEVSEGPQKEGSHAPRKEGKMEWEVVRFTPNGTQVPSGPPPLERPGLSQMPTWNRKRTGYEMAWTATTSG